MRARRTSGVALLAAALAATTAIAVMSSGSAGAEEDSGDDARLYLVTLRGPGTAGHPGPRSAAALTDRMLATQEQVLQRVAAAAPVYRWTTALNGFAVELDDHQADALTGDPRVAYVEHNAVRPLARTTAEPGRTTTPGPGIADRTSRGAGTVIGFVDTGIDPASRAFSPVAALGPPPRRFRGGCTDAPDDPAWDSSDCTAKIAGAQYYVHGFGEDRLRSATALSPIDSHGHGTQVASIAAGTADVPVRAGQHRLGRFSGVAPRARIAVYKACWAAPDPADDGCATADLVAAIDQATADRVDVLNLSVGGPSATIDTVERALLGATEAGAVVAAAAGNAGPDAYAAHPAPWVITVGASIAAERVGAVVTHGGTRWRGAMAATDGVGRSRLVIGENAVADGASRADAGRCVPGSLDARLTSDAIVLCRRGGAGRIEKSEAVRLADGAGMVLVNTAPGSTDADLHSVPTVHLSARDGRALRRWAAERRHPLVRLAPHGMAPTPVRMAPFSSGGDPTWALLKPDLVAPGTNVLAAVPGGWDVVSGTSAATAHVSGAAAILLGQPAATPAAVRSALLTTTSPVTGPTGLRAGTGQVRVRRLPPMGYLTDTRDYRRWLSGRRVELGLPQARLRTGRLAVRRTITNTGRGPLWLTSHLESFDSPVRVSPSAGLVRPGRTLTFTISAPSAPGHTDTGAVVWHSESGDETRLAVVITR